MPIRNVTGDPRNLGSFADLAALQAEFPVGEEGWFAIVDNGELPAELYLWDSAPAPGAWTVSSATGAIVLQAIWNALTNTPDISTTTVTGHAWVVSVAGATDLGGITDWEVGDIAVKSATGWIKIDNEDIAAVWGGITGTLADQVDLQAALDAKVSLTGDEIIAGLKTFSTPPRASTLNTGDNIITTDTDGDFQESGVKVETAPAGGSGFTVIEYVSAPAAPVAGFLWIEAVDVNTKKLAYFDGTNTFSVELGKE